MNPADELREKFAYDPTTGVFIRRSTGKVAGHRKNNGYLHFHFAGKKRGAHRLAWLYVHGSWPEHDVDHINGIRSDNRICNLRDVSRSVNLQNQRRPASHNKSTGVLGVYRHVGGRFMSRICVNQRGTYLGLFDTIEAAQAAYLEAKHRLHPGSTI
mgnify:CR=1 FL=1